MRTFDQTPIWDGKCIFPKAATDSLISAFVNFVEGIGEKPDGHIGILWTASPESKDIFAMVPMSTFDGDRNPGCLSEFMRIPGQKSMKRTTIAQELAAFRLPTGKQYVCPILSMLCVWPARIMRQTQYISLNFPVIGSPGVERGTNSSVITKVS